ncbi:FRG domain-containing protein [Faecalispora jeddahensis]|uniref:FRG domain-containing protein n=1 Tax=Faecalispora jeddahensis TaxID=1414721 RepID=UPI001898202B|nr:FRG domain-containing protein [Faecalispora jeddahensis]
MDLTITNITELFQILNKLRGSYPQRPTESPFIYRGVSDNGFSLIPSIFRQVEEQIEDDDFQEPIKNYKYLAHSKEKTILRDFITQASGYIKDIPIDDYLHWAEYAQHFGAPTRLLDWTSNPLVAMFFACINNKNDDAAIWILHKGNYRNYRIKHSKYSDEEKEIINRLSHQELFNSFFDDKNKIDLKYPLIYHPYYVDSRMEAQSSVFMFWGTSQESLENMVPKENYLVPQDPFQGVVYGEKQTQEVLLELRIPQSTKQSFIRQLEMIGINYKTLFPGLDGIGKYIEHKYRFDYNEAIQYI